MEGEVGSADLVTRRSSLPFAITALLAGAAIATSSSSRAQTAGDVDAMNLMLNVEYLIAQYLSFVVNGAGLAPNVLTGAGVQGQVTAGRKLTPPPSAPILSIMAEMAGDNLAHLAPIRADLGILAVAQPSIDITGGTSGPFTRLMRGAGIVDASGTFDPYGSEENVLYTVYFLKSVSVTGYAGILGTLSNRVIVQRASGILQTEATHAATVRAILYDRGATIPRYRTNADAISAYARALNRNAATDVGISPVQKSYAGGASAVTVSRIAQADADGMQLARTPGQILNLLYLTNGQASSGGFFPNGVNGTIRTSAAA